MIVFVYLCVFIYPTILTSRASTDITKLKTQRVIDSDMISNNFEKSKRVDNRQTRETGRGRARERERWTGGRADRQTEPEQRKRIGGGGGCLSDGRTRVTGSCFLHFGVCVSINDGRVSRMHQTNSSCSHRRILARVFANVLISCTRLAGIQERSPHMQLGTFVLT